MPKANSETAACEGYAQALLAVAKGESLLDQVETELTELKEVLLGDDKLLPFLKDRKVSPEGKRKALLELLGEEVSVITRSQLGLVIDQGKAESILGVIEAYFALSAASRKKVSATVTTAIELRRSTEQEIEQTLSELVGEPVFLKTFVDPDILGGLMIQLGDRIIDGSLRSRLIDIRQGLSRRILTEKGKFLED